MAKKSESPLQRHFSRLRQTILLIFTLSSLVQLGMFALLISVIWGEQFEEWLPELIIGSVILATGAIIVLFLLRRHERDTRWLFSKALERETKQLRSADQQVKSLQVMASTLSATLSHEKVMEVALDVCFLTINEIGVPDEAQVGAVFLYDEEELAPSIVRGFTNRDNELRIPGQSGIVGQAVGEAEPVITHQPKQDPELQSFASFQECQTVVCIPLRAGFQIYGVIILGMEPAIEIQDKELALFSSVADQAVISLQNAQMYQNLTAERHKIIEAEEVARRALARALYEGPAQNVATIAMHLGFVRSFLAIKPDQAALELKKAEKLALDTSSDFRRMLFKLRPMEMETKGLSAAIEAAAEKIRDENGPNVRFLGSEFGELLDDETRVVVFYIIEEALTNAQKYSQANSIEICLDRENNTFIAQVKDDGMGFDPEDVVARELAEGYLGLMYMRERAERIDSSLDVRAAPNQGTTITLTVPLDQHGRQGLG